MKIKKLKPRNLNRTRRTGFRLVSGVLIILMGITTLTTLIASKVYAAQLNIRLTQQDIKLHKNNEALKRTFVENSVNRTISSSLVSRGSSKPAEKLQPETVASSGSDAYKNSSKSINTKNTAPSASTTKAAPAAAVPINGLETSSSLSYINSLRATVGKAALSQNSVMDRWALEHAQRLAESCSLFHQSMNDFLNRNIGPVSTHSIAENVGYANTTQAVLDALKNSPGHYANMTGDYQFIGIGIVKANSGSCSGYIYTTQMFAK